MEQPGRIPVIGRLTPLELLGFVGLALAAGLSALEIAAPWPESAFPAVLVLGSVVLSSCVAFVLLVLRVKHRLEGRPRPPAREVDPGALRRLTDAMTASLVMQAVCMVLPVLVGTMSVGAAAALLFTIVAAGIVFLTCLGRLAARLGRSWLLWVGMTMITPFGPFIAYFMMRSLVKEATRRPSS